MGLDMYLEGSFSTPSYIRPTDADYEARQEGKEIVVKRSPELEDALNAIGFQDAPIDHAYNHMTYVFPIITWRKANAIHKFFVDSTNRHIFLNQRNNLQHQLVIALLPSFLWQLVFLYQES